MVQLTLEEQLYSFREEVSASFRRNLKRDKALARRYAGIRSSIGAYDALSIQEIKDILSQGDRSLLEETGFFASLRSGFRNIASYARETVSSSYIRNNLSLLESAVVVKGSIPVPVNAFPSYSPAPAIRSYSSSRYSFSALALGCAAALFSFYSKPAQPSVPETVAYVSLSPLRNYGVCPSPFVLPFSKEPAVQQKPVQNVVDYGGFSYTDNTPNVTAAIDSWNGDARTAENKSPAQFHNGVHRIVHREDFAEFLFVEENIVKGTGSYLLSDRAANRNSPFLGTDSPLLLN